MADINHVVLVGRLTRDAELKFTATAFTVHNIDPKDGTRELEAQGAYSQLDNTVSFTFEGETVTGSIKGNKLTFSIEGMTMTFTKK